MAPSGLDVRDLGLYVVRPTLAALAVAAPGIDGPVAEALLLGTAAQESGFRRLRQQGGPALGLWQMEPATEADLRRWLWHHPTLGAVDLIVTIEGLADQRLCWDLRYACAMARLLYWRVPEPLPPPPVLSGIIAPGMGMALALWPYYKKWYNSENGAATEKEFISNYLALVAPFWPPPSTAGVPAGATA